MSLVFVPILLAADRAAPQGQVENDLVSVTATTISAEDLRQIFSTDFGGHFTVMKVTVSPKGGKSLDIRMDDFLLRSSNGKLDHSGPLAAGQIVEGSALTVQQTFAPRSDAENPAMLAGSKVEMKQAPANPAQIALLKQHILAEATIIAPASGLLFFPLEREKPKNLALVYTTASGKIRLQFK